MKKLVTLTFILFFAFSIYGQTTKPTNPDAEDKQLLAELQTAKNNLFNCYDTYFNSKEVNKLEISQKCIETASIGLAEIYGKLAKAPNAIKLLLSKEIENNYRNSAARLQGVGKSAQESALDSQSELQRIIVIQNQRIIELLEQLVKKK